MKLTALIVMLMVALALFAGAGDAAPQPAKRRNSSALKKAGKIISKILDAMTVAATAYDLFKPVEESEPNKLGSEMNTNERKSIIKPPKNTCPAK